MRGEIDWDKVQTIEHLKTIVKLIVYAYGGSSKIFVAESYFNSANETTKKRLEEICKEAK